MRSQKVITFAGGNPSTNLQGFWVQAGFTSINDLIISPDQLTLYVALAYKIASITISTTEVNIFSDGNQRSVDDNNVGGLGVGNRCWLHFSPSGKKMYISDRVYMAVRVIDMESRLTDTVAGLLAGNTDGVEYDARLTSLARITVSDTSEFLIVSQYTDRKIKIVTLLESGPAECLQCPDHYQAVEISKTFANGGTGLPCINFVVS